MFLRVASFFYTIEAQIPRGRKQGYLFLERAKDGEPRQEEEAVGTSFWTFSLAHASLPEDLRV
jgi:hypothetical protein